MANRLVASFIPLADTHPKWFLDLPSGGPTRQARPIFEPRKEKPGKLDPGRCLVNGRNCAHLITDGVRKGGSGWRGYEESAACPFHKLIEFGAALTRDMIPSGEVLQVSRDIIRPFYERKCEQVLEWIREDLEGLSYRVHKPEGAFFFWLWFAGLPITSKELYQRLKERGVLVVPGDYFFPGLEQDWQQKHECMRLNDSQDDDTVRRGIAILADELRKVS